MLRCTVKGIALSLKQTEESNIDEEGQTKVIVFHVNKTHCLCPFSSPLHRFCSSGGVVRTRENHAQRTEEPEDPQESWSTLEQPEEQKLLPILWMTQTARFDLVLGSGEARLAAASRCFRLFQVSRRTSMIRFHFLEVFRVCWQQPGWRGWGCHTVRRALSGRSTRLLTSLYRTGSRTLVQPRVMQTLQFCARRTGISEMQRRLVTAVAHMAGCFFTSHIANRLLWLIHQRCTRCDRATVQNKTEKQRVLNVGDERFCQTVEQKAMTADCRTCPKRTM